MYASSNSVSHPNWPMYRHWMGCFVEYEGGTNSLARGHCMWTGKRPLRFMSTRRNQTMVFHHLHRVAVLSSSWHGVGDEGSVAVV